MIRIKNCYLQETCCACPEQYDVFLMGKRIGYLRLRNGYFRAHYLNASGKCVFQAITVGDGQFEDFERMDYLNAAVDALLMEVQDHIY